MSCERLAFSVRWSPACYGWIARCGPKNSVGLRKCVRFAFPCTPEGKRLAGLAVVDYVANRRPPDDPIDPAAKAGHRAKVSARRKAARIRKQTGGPIVRKPPPARLPTTTLYPAGEPTHSRADPLAELRMSVEGWKLPADWVLMPGENPAEALAEYLANWERRSFRPAKRRRRSALPRLAVATAD